MERRLTRGLESLLGKGAAQVASSQSVQSIPIDQIRPNPKQPRGEFDPVELASLQESIATDGLLQPVVVRRTDEGYELIAGERRFRACKALDHPKIPALIRSVEQEQQLVLALVENLQRSDLNPVEEARAFHLLREEFGLTHEQVAKKVGKDRSTVSNTLRLLELPAAALKAVSRGTITAGHARALLPLIRSAKFELFLGKVIEEGLSVRQTERVVRELVGGSEEVQGDIDEPATTGKSRTAPERPASVGDFEDRIRAAWGTRVRVRVGRRGGEVAFVCTSREELDDVLNRLAAPTQVPLGRATPEDPGEELEFGV